MQVTLELRYTVARSHSIAALLTKLNQWRLISANDRLNQSIILQLMQSIRDYDVLYFISFTPGNYYFSFIAHCSTSRLRWLAWLTMSYSYKFYMADWCTWNGFIYVYNFYYIMIPSCKVGVCRWRITFSTCICVYIGRHR